MKEKHVVNIENFKDYSFASVAACSVGSGNDKSLKVVVVNDKVHYEVVDHGNIAIAYTLEAAINLYNKL